VVRLGICPKPLVRFSVFHHALIDGGIMITGGVRPASENGFEVFLGKRTLSQAELSAITREEGRAFHAQGRVTDLHVQPLYLRHVFSACLSFRPEPPSERKRIVLDLGNGSAATLFPGVLRPHFSTHLLGATRDGRYPNRHPAALGARDLEPLGRSVIENRARFGIAVDGDSNRLAVVDESGKLLSEDELQSLLSRNPARSVRKTAYYSYDDAIFSTLRICEIASHTDTPISRL
jgi:phosphomannomutase